jgi:hypothetical protein
MRGASLSETQRRAGTQVGAYQASGPNESSS